MRVKPVGDRGWFVVLEVGEEIVESLTRLADEEGIEGAFVTGLGSLREVTLGFFDPAEKEYGKRTFEEPMELGNLVGDVSVSDGEPVLHAHVTVCGPELIAYTGRLFRGVVGGMGEFHVMRLPFPLTRVLDEALGLELVVLDPPPAEEDSEG